MEYFINPFMFGFQQTDGVETALNTRLEDVLNREVLSFLPQEEEFVINPDILQVPTSNNPESKQYSLRE